jgi:hypothetical protein
MLTEMNAEEWERCSDPDLILDFAHGRVSDRKLRFFACVCCWRFLDWLDSEHDRKAIEVAEAIADGKRPAQRCADAHIHGYDLDLGEDDAYLPAIGAACVGGVCAADRSHPEKPSGEAWQAAHDQEREALCKLLRCIVGNPFRPTPLLPPSVLARNDGAAVKMATVIYDERAWDRLPILADALADAGCDEAELLGHLRGPGPHSRGCWAVDAILGRS